MKNYEVDKKSRKSEFFKALEDIKKDFITEKCKDSIPMFILAGGQPGSGKTKMITTIEQDYLNKKFVVIDLDMFRTYHPDFEEIKKYHKKDGVLLTNSFAFEIENELIKYCLENKYNVINVTTLRNTEMIINNIKNILIPSGYNIKIYVLIVSPEESYYSTLLRFKEQQQHENILARFNSKTFNDEAYLGLNNTIKALFYEKYPLAICERAVTKKIPPKVVYDSIKDEYFQSYKDLENLIIKIKKQSYNRLKKNIENLNIEFLNDEKYVENDLNNLIKQIKNK